MRKWVNIITEAETNETMVIDVPMLQARGLKNLLQRCIDSALGNLAFQEEHVPLRRRYIVRGDHKIISVLRRHLATRGIVA